MTSKKRLNILMADDSSQHARAAVELLLDVSLPPKSRIMLLRVFTPDQIEGLPEFEKGLARTHKQLLDAGIATETDLILGSPAEKIIEMAQSKKSDLIVLGARGLRSALGILLGGVAQQVVEYAHCPVLVVRAPYQGLSRILLVTDGSPYSQLATRYLCRFPLPRKADVHVMHVMPPMQLPVNVEPYLGSWHTVYVPLMNANVETALANRQKQRGQALLKRTCDMLQRNGITAVPVLTRGDAATEIMDYVKSSEIDLIVAGSRGLGQFKGIWMGSVSRKLVHYSNCSVLIVKGPKKE